MAAIGLSGFADKFRADADPWSTFSDADEALKRRAILRALGAGRGGGPLGRVLELGAGNGSNSAALADRALRLDATEGTREGTALVARALAPGGRLVMAHHRIDYYDFAQHAEGIHRRFLADTGARWRCVGGHRTARWIVAGWTRG